MNSFLVFFLLVGGLYLFLLPTMDANLTACLGQLEDTLRGFPKDVKITVDVGLLLHDDVPDGFVEEDVYANSTGYNKVVDAQGGTATKIIVLSVPD